MRKIDGKTVIDLINTGLDKRNDSSLYINRPTGYLATLMVMTISYILSIIFLIFGVITNVFLGTFSPYIVSLILFIVGIISNSHFLKLLRYRKYVMFIEKNNEASIDWISRNLKISSSIVRKDLNKMINNGIFTQGHLLKDSRYFVLNDELYSKYLVYKENERKVLAENEAIKSNSELSEFIENTTSYINTLNKQKSSVNNTDLKIKIDSIVLSVNNIKNYIKKHPEDIYQLDRFSDYYLPKTVELINKYMDIESNDNSIELFRKSKKDIFDTINTMDNAFKKLLNNLAESNSIDVNSDIYVLNTMLSQDGLKDTLK